MESPKHSKAQTSPMYNHAASARAGGSRSQALRRRATPIAGQQIGEGGAEDREIERVTDEAVLALDEVEGAVVGRQPVDSDREERDDGGQGDREERQGQGAEREARPGAPRAQTEQVRQDRPGEQQEEHHARRPRRQPREPGGNPGPLLAEERAAAGGDDVRVEAVEVRGQQAEVEEREGREQQHPGARRAHEREVRRGDVQAVQREPEDREHEQRHLHEQHPPPDRVRVERPGRAHRPGEERVDPLEGVEQQRQRNDLQAERKRDEGRDHRRAPLERELCARGAGEIPAAQHRERGGGGTEEQRADHGLAEDQGDQRGVEDHRGVPGQSRPSRSSTTRETSGCPRTNGSWVAMMSVRPSARNPASSSSISAARARSRWEVGSSATTTAGSFTRARAIATRCCSPPERQLDPGGGPRRQTEALEHCGAAPRRRRRRPVSRVQRRDDVGEGAHPGNQVELLEDEAETGAAQFAEETLGQLGNLAALEEDAPRARPGQAGEESQERGLAGSARAPQHERLAALHRERDSRKRREFVGQSLVEDLGQRLGCQECRHG